jgi:peptidyl-prolyl cis-trans isomerase D
MLDVLRASKGGIITWIFLAAIIVMFVISFGPGSLTKQRGTGGCGGTPSYAAQVDGQVVSIGLYERQLQQIASFYRAQYGDEFVRMMMPVLGEQAMTSVVNRTLLIQEARRRGLRVTDAEITKLILASPSFQENGKFSKDVYQDAAAQQFGSTRQYEENLRSELLLQRLDGAFEATVKVPESEVHQAWVRNSDRADLTYVIFPTADGRAEVKATDAEVQAFAAKEAARIEKFYQDNPARFDQPQKARVRHILAKAVGTDDAAAKKKIEAARARLDKGEDFAKVAAEVSEDDNTKANGGDLGVISAGAADDAFAKAALALPAGKLSEPVKTPTGWHLIKVDEVIPAKKTPLETVRTELAKELLVGDRAAALLHEKAEAALAAAKGGKALTDLFPAPQAAQPAADGKPAVPERLAALTLGGKPVVARQTGSFQASGSYVPGINGAADLLKDALAARSGDVLPRVYQTPGGLVVAVVKERKRPDEAAYAAERAGVESQLKSEQGQQLRQAWVADLRARVKVVENTAIVPKPQERAN